MSLSTFSPPLSSGSNFSPCLAEASFAYCEVPYDIDIFVWWNSLQLTNISSCRVTCHSHCQLSWHTDSLVSKMACLKVSLFHPTSPATLWQQGGLKKHPWAWPGTRPYCSKQVCATCSDEHCTVPKIAGCKQPHSAFYFTPPNYHCIRQLSSHYVWHGWGDDWKHRVMNASSFVDYGVLLPALFVCLFVCLFSGWSLTGKR